MNRTLHQTPGTLTVRWRKSATKIALSLSVCSVGDHNIFDYAVVVTV